MRIQPGQLWAPANGNSADLRLVVSVDGTGVHFAQMCGEFRCTFAEWRTWTEECEAECVID